MDTYLKLKTFVTSTALAVGFAGATLLILKYKLRKRNAVDALNYLIIRNVITEESCDEVINELRRRIGLHKAVGFDCEWVTNQGRRQPVALVQLSSYDGYCGLFRLSHLKTIPNSLKELLEDENIFKVGVAPFDDAKYLLSDYSVSLKSTLDLRHIVELAGHTSGGLAFLAQSELNIILDKSWRVRCSNWEVDELTQTQINYAAADAHVSIKIFVYLINKKYGSIWSWLNRSSDNKVWHNINNICWKYADIGFKNKHTSKLGSEIKKDKEGKLTKDSVVSKRYPHATRSKPLYHNCFLVAPDGELLCTCDTKKAEWYVDKGLADVVNDNPLTVRLRFEPSGRSVGDVGRYYQLTKENKCVVCGGDNSYIRKNVVPREYRKYFPEIMKDHSSHDVVLLCTGCHQRSNMRDQAVRERLAEQCGAPLAAHTDNKFKEDADCKKIRSAARALLYQSRKHVLPEERRKELEQIILRNFPQHEQITEELLQKVADMQVVFENIDYESHGHKVVEYFMKHEGLLQLERLWRQHFLTSMRPRHMPQLWSLDHNEQRLKIRLEEGRLSDEDAKLIGL
ncbi:Exonuclease 3'-5' domain-containing protein 2 [Papilio machaon]|uniref:Exonuclease 3'-5' domain-containing protein 2 n=1 Tax=Papilio machaon TaxID=76193 RepID=A0A194RKG0_PAPMA|nr:Exonuclease 3'-5' domain-containing protein 2 [Papilio machaon]